MADRVDVDGHIRNAGYFASHWILRHGKHVRCIDVFRKSAFA